MSDCVSYVSTGMKDVICFGTVKPSACYTYWFQSRLLEVAFGVIFLAEEGIYEEPRRLFILNAPNLL